jgi:hypothetical protein
MSRPAVTELASVVEKIPTQRLSCLAAMRERRGEVTCFTPALLVTAGLIPVDPVNEFVARLNVPESGRPFCVEVPPPAFPFFSGLGTTSLNGSVINWDRRLYAVPESHAKACLDFLGGIGIVGQNHIASSVTYTIDIPDPTMPQFSDSRHFIPVTIFGILRDDKITYLEPNKFLPPFLKTIPANPALKSSQFRVGLGADQFKEILEEL